MTMELQFQRPLFPNRKAYRELLCILYGLHCMLKFEFKCGKRHIKDLLAFTLGSHYPRASPTNLLFSAMAITRSFKMPDLLSICHFPSSMSPDSAKASADSIEWICSTEALGTNDEGANKRWHGYFSQAGGTLLASYVYCYTPYEKLRLCCDLVNVLFAMDEITDTQSGAEARGTMEHHIRILCGEASDNTPVSKMTSS